MDDIIEESRPIDESLDYLIPTAEIAKLLGCGKNFVGELISVGLLTALKFNRTRKVRKTTFNKFLEDFDGCDLFELVQSKKESLSNDRLMG
ncbi:MAG: DNA-binding protein [Neobacillus sp.]|jgi:excisionase family DNA binding protein|nr:DNA-binding protein [Neobacillus sp.]